MAKTKTSFNADNQPKQRKPRGKSERTKILESFKRLSRTEDEFYDLLTDKAFSPEDQFSFKELLSRLSPIPKAVAPLINFTFDKEGNIGQQSAQIVDAIAKGEIPPDLGNLLMGSMQAMYKIKELSEFAEKLDQLETLLAEKDKANNAK